MARILISETVTKVGEKVVLQGWVATKRDHGKVSFIDLRDQSGIVQVVDVNGKFSELKTFDAVEISGLVKKRPEKLINPKLETGEIEIESQDVKVLSASQELPFDMTSQELNLELPTLLDNRSLTLKHASQIDIFKVQAKIASGFRNAAEKIGCTEIFVPTIAASSTEGGSEVFKVQYYDHDAFLIQSPQLYKQIMTGALERVYVISHVYRAEPSVTTRHLSEVVQMDCEIGFINSFDELLDYAEFIGVETIKNAQAGSPLIPTKVPRLTLREAQAIVQKRTGRDLTQELDLNPEDEKEIADWAREEHNSDLVTITHFPTKKRAFYSLPDPKDPEYCLSFDIVFRGLEICSGSQRINDYTQLVKVIKDRGMNPDDFEMYLQAFKYGMPPEGGFSFGLERLTMKLLGLDNVRKASLFPRDMERVDIRLK